MNKFEWKGGSLYHFINDELRAVVANEHATEYLVAIDANPDEVPAP